MGNTISEILGTGEKEKKATGELDLMLKLAGARLDDYENKLKNMFLDKACEYGGYVPQARILITFALLFSMVRSTQAAAKTSVPGNRALRFERSVTVNTTTAVRVSWSVKVERDP